MPPTSPPTKTDPDLYTLKKGKTIMTRNTKLSIAAAALTGLLAGTASRALAAAPSHSSDTSSARKVLSTGQKAISMADDTDKHSCKGQNSCKGKGGCKTGDNGCKGKNSCKGKGGCKTTEDKL